jgi:hypothetical protein
MPRPSKLYLLESRPTEMNDVHPAKRWRVSGVYQTQRSARLATQRSDFWDYRIAVYDRRRAK